MWKIMCFLNHEPRKRIALHQIHQIMFFLATSYDRFKLTDRSVTWLAIKGCLREAESLRSKDGKRSTICERVRKKIVEYFKNKRLCKLHHLQCITSSKDSEKLEKSLCVRDKAERPKTFVGCPWSLGPQMTLHHSSAWFCHWHY